MVSLPDKLAKASKASASCSAFKVPALLPDRRLPQTGFKAMSTFFLFFSLGLFSKHANRAKMQLEGFLPDGLFARILGT